MHRKIPVARAVAIAFAFTFGPEAATAATAPNAQVSVSAFASDTPSGASFIRNSDGSLACCFATASKTTDATAGNASSHAEAQANALTGAIREKATSSVAANVFVVGRNSGADSIASMSGGIAIAGPSLPALATFTAVLDGTYSVATPAPSNFANFDNRIELSYALILGSSPEFNDRITYLCCTPGTFSIPFSWTQEVKGGDLLDFSLFLKTSVFSVAGSSTIDALNTFRITGVNLPVGFSFAPEAGGFLSQFGQPAAPAAIPLPPGIWLFMPALGAFAVAFRRRRDNA